MNELSFCTDKDFNISSWGKQLSEFTGRISSQVVGRKYYEVLPRIIYEHEDALAVAMKSKTQLFIKGFSFHCFHSSIPVDIKITPYMNGTGTVKKVKVSFQSLSLCSVAKKLDDSRRLIDIGKIASSLAHGVRNPLNAIKGSVVYLREKYRGEETLLEFTRIIEEEITRLENFITKFLSSSMIDLENSETDINRVLEKLEIFISLQAHALKIKCQFKYGNIPLVVVNSFYLEQAVLNVINNALEAMGSGGLLKVETYRKKLGDEDFAIIEVSDSGHGITEKKIQDMAPGKNRRGRGFGLFITHEILKSFNGRFEIKSKKNVGTTVRLCIPCK
jgi:two-component system nitrogen regulation sensor histidine kinase GlnL